MRVGNNHVSFNNLLGFTYYGYVFKKLDDSGLSSNIRYRDSRTLNVVFSYSLLR
jgi:hypothetical protein